MMRGKRPMVAVRIENTYTCGRESASTEMVPAPDGTPTDEWWTEHVHDLTGDGHPCGSSEHALYEATIVAGPHDGASMSWEG